MRWSDDLNSLKGQENISRLHTDFKSPIVNCAMHILWFISTKFSWILGKSFTPNKQIKIKKIQDKHWKYDLTSFEAPLLLKDMRCQSFSQEETLASGQKPGQHLVPLLLRPVSVLQEYRGPLLRYHYRCKGTHDQEGARQCSCQELVLGTVCLNQRFGTAAEGRAVSFYSSLECINSEDLALQPLVLQSSLLLSLLHCHLICLCFC